MKIIIYSKKDSEAGVRLQKVLGFLVPGEQTECYRTIENLSRRLRQPQKENVIAVLLLTDRQELLNMLSLQSLLQDIRIILVLPDRKESTINDAHKLYPRFVSYINDNNYNDIVAVLKKMRES